MNEEEISKIKDAARLLVEVVVSLSDRKNLSPEDTTRIMMSHFQEQFIIAVRELEQG